MVLKRMLLGGLFLIIAIALVGQTSSAEEKVTLRACLHNTWIPGGPAIVETGEPSVIVRKIIPEYEKTHPNVKLEFEALQGGTEGRTLYLLRCRQGTQPDIITLDGYWIAEFAALGYTYPLDDLIPQELKDDYYDAFLIRYKGKIHGIVPDTAFNSMLWYRTDLFAEAGLPGAPKDWNEMRDYAKKLLIVSPEGETIRYGLSTCGAKSEHTTVINLGFYWQGEDVFVTPDNEPAFNNQTSLDVFNLFGAMAKEDKSLPPETINMLYDDVDKIFYADKAAMMLHGSWLAARIETVAPNLEGKIGLAPNPAYPRTQGRGTNAGGWGVGLTTKDPEKYQPAWDFIYLLVGGDPDYKLEILLEGGNLPVQRSMAEVWKPKLIKPEWVEIIMDELQYAKTRPAVEIYPDASLEWSQAFQEVIMGVKTTEQALKDATERVIEIAEEKGYIE